MLTTSAEITVKYNIKLYILHICLKLCYQLLWVVGRQILSSISSTDYTLVLPRESYPMFQMDTRAVFARPVLVSVDVIYAWAANARRKACAVDGARCGTSENKKGWRDCPTRLIILEGNILLMLKRWAKLWLIIRLILHFYKKTGERE